MAADKREMIWTVYVGDPFGCWVDNRLYETKRGTKDSCGVTKIVQVKDEGNLE